MNKLEELFENAINHWRLNKGIGTCLIPYPLDDKYMVLGVLQRIYARLPTNKTTIIVSSFKDRTDIIEFLTTQEDSEENNLEFKKLIDDKFIKVVTYNFIEKYYPAFPSHLCVLYRPETISSSSINFLKWCKFKLVILNKILSKGEDMSTIYKICPLLDEFKQAEVEQVRLSTPVEEIRIPIIIPEDSNEFNLLNKYNEFITTSVNIFGTFDMIQKAYRGDKTLNISAKQICYSIAKDNGWDEHLDMSIEFNKEIDSLYNPIALQDRAENTFSIIRERNNLLSDYFMKLNAVADIVSNNKDKKFLIINKRADFARLVTDFLNNIVGDRNDVNMICMNYHDKVDYIPGIDANLKPVYYQSGARKGQRKMLGAKAQKSLAEALFEKGNINVLSANNMPDKSLSGTIDGIILTSPMCSDINSYIYRLSNLCFRDNKILLYSLYCKNTLEEKILENKDRATNHNVKNSYQDENFSDFLIVD